MRVTFFSIVMSVVWSSLLLVLFTLLRKNSRLLDLCSIPGMIVLYAFGAIRMLIPIEFPWTKAVSAAVVFNPAYTFIRRQIPGVPATVGRLLLIIWALIALILLIRIIVNYKNFYTRMKGVCGLGRELEATNYGIEKSAGIRIYQSPAVEVPLSYGIRDKRIVILDGGYSENETELIVRHEKAHLENSDPAVQLLANILCAIYWWNPFVYVFRSNLEQIFEIRCDKTVTADMTPAEAADYLETLLKIYRNTAGEHIRTGVGVIENAKAGGDELKERFEYLSKHIGRNKRDHTGVAAALTIACLLLVISYSFIFQSAYDAPQLEDGAYYIDPGNTYLLRRADGTYVIISEKEAPKEISLKTAEMMINDGFYVREE